MQEPKKRLGSLVASIDPDARKKQQDDNAESPSRQRPERRHTGVGMVLGAIAGSADLERQLSETQSSLTKAQEKLADFEGAELVQLLDPRAVRRSHWANRDLSNFQGQTWSDFKDEISSSGGNIEAIKVRRIPSNQAPEFSEDGTVRIEYESAFGQRRHRACLELGIPLRAVVVDTMDDKTLFAEMDRENRQRESLSPWEQGKSYNQALQEGLYPSLRKLAADLGVNLSLASRYCSLAQLPLDVINAFPTPMTLQVRWAKPLADAMQSDPGGTIQRAKALHSLKGTISATEVLARILKEKAAEPEAPKSIEIEAKGKPAASLKVLPKGKVAVEFEPGLVKPEQHEELAKLITKFLENS